MQCEATAERHNRQENTEECRSKIVRRQCGYFYAGRGGIKETDEAWPRSSVI